MSKEVAKPDFWQHDLVPPAEHKELNVLNLGPTHPATHGIFQNVLTMDGEYIQSAEQTIGYIHRAFEKICLLYTSKLLLRARLPIFSA